MCYVTQTWLIDFTSTCEENAKNVTAIFTNRVYNINSLVQDCSNSIAVLH